MSNCLQIGSLNSIILVSRYRYFKYLKPAERARGMKLAEGVVTSRAIAVLISAATRLELIDHWETRSSKVIFVKGPVCYHVGMDNAAAFLESLINLHEVEQMGVKPIK